MFPMSFITTTTTTTTEEVDMIYTKVVRSTDWYALTHWRQVGSIMSNEAMHIEHILS